MFVFLLNIFITDFPSLHSFRNHLTGGTAGLRKNGKEISEEYLVKRSSNHKAQIKPIVVACEDKS